MSTELLPAENQQSIRESVDSFSCSVMERWFFSLPNETRQTPCSAILRDEQLGRVAVRKVGGPFREILAVYFKPEASPNVTILSRRFKQWQGDQVTTHDINVLADNKPAWRRNDTGTLELVPAGFTFGGLRYTDLFEPTIARIEAETPVQAEESLKNIASLVARTTVTV